MSMPMLVSSPREDDAGPQLRLADDAAPSEAPPMLEQDATPRVFVRDGKLFADDRATLPAACVVCGDTLDPTAIPTPRGRIAFSLCHEHLIHAAVRLVAGLSVCAAAAYVVARGSGSRMSSLMVFAFLGSIGGALALSAMPVWTWRRKGEPRQLFRVGVDVRRSIESATR